MCCSGEDFDCDTVSPGILGFCLPGRTENLAGFWAMQDWVDNPGVKDWMCMLKKVTCVIVPPAEFIANLVQNADKLAPASLY